MNKNGRTCIISQSSLDKLGKTGEELSKEIGIPVMVTDAVPKDTFYMYDTERLEEVLQEGFTFPNRTKRRQQGIKRNKQQRAKRKLQRKARRK